MWSHVRDDTWCIITFSFFLFGPLVSLVCFAVILSLSRVVVLTFGSSSPIHINMYTLFLLILFLPGCACAWEWHEARC
jgi:hypothetical protein